MYNSYLQRRLSSLYLAQLYTMSYLFAKEMNFW